jgi:hypothetical protein
LALERQVTKVVRLELTVAPFLSHDHHCVV